MRQAGLGEALMEKPICFAALVDDQTMEDRPRHALDAGAIMTACLVPLLTCYANDRAHRGRAPVTQ